MAARHQRLVRSCRARRRRARRQSRQRIAAGLAFQALAQALGGARRDRRSSGRLDDLGCVVCREVGDIDAAGAGEILRSATRIRHLGGVTVAHRALILVERGIDSTGGAQLVVLRKDHGAVGGIDETTREQTARHGERGLQRRADERHLGRRDAGFGNGPRQHGGDGIARVEQQTADDGTPDGVQPRRRIDYAGRDVVMRQQRLVMHIGAIGGAADVLLETARARSDDDIGTRPDAARFGVGHEPVVGATDAPLDGAMKIVLRLRLAGVQRHQRIGDVMAEHAGRIRHLRPVARLQRLDQRLMPLHNLLRRAAPVVVARVQNVIGEILEHVVGRLGAFEETRAVDEQHALPAVRVLARQTRQRIERELVMRAGGVRGAQDSIEQAHRLETPEQTSARMAVASTAASGRASRGDRPNRVGLRWISRAPRSGTAQLFGHRQ